MIVSVKHCLKELDVQASPCGDMLQRRGIVVMESVMVLHVD